MSRVGKNEAIMLPKRHTGGPRNKCAFFAGETPEVKILNSIKSHAFYRMKEKILTW